MYVSLLIYSTSPIAAAWTRELPIQPGPFRFSWFDAETENYPVEGREDHKLDRSGGLQYCGVCPFE
jgi:hypothetical protein